MTSSLTTIQTKSIPGESVRLTGATDAIELYTNDTYSATSTREDAINLANTGKETTYREIEFSIQPEP